jgi:hypothetical protein
MARENKPAKEKFFEDALGQKWVAVFSLSAFLGIGIWMLLDPSGGKHSGYEKSTVYLIKEIWSFNTGVVICAISIFFLAKTILKIRMMKTFSWVKMDSGYYLMQDQVRISGLQSLYDGDDLIVFNPSVNEVYKFPKYSKAKLNKYKKAEYDDRFNCMDAYWTADKDGYYLYYKGVRVENLTSEYRGDDLIATSSGLGKKFRLPNYKGNLDNRIRGASRY